MLHQQEPTVTISEIMEAFKSKRAEQRIPVLRLEIDYELAVLFDALKWNDRFQIDDSTIKLKRLRTEMLLLEL